jgi:hypothetical protein
MVPFQKLEQTRDILDLLFHIKERSYKLPTKDELKRILEFLNFIRNEYPAENNADKM